MKTSTIYHNRGPWPDHHPMEVGRRFSVVTSDGVVQVFRKLRKPPLGSWAVGGVELQRRGSAGWEYIDGYHDVSTAMRAARRLVVRCAEGRVW